jgi:hypothetical protein
VSDDRLYPGNRRLEPVSDRHGDRPAYATRRQTGPVAAVSWLAAPMPLWPEHSKVMVHGVSSDASEDVKREWLRRGGAAGRHRALV